jgi:hypothetical protein
LLHEPNRYLLTAVVLFITFGCSGSKALRVSPDAGGTAGASTAVWGPDAMSAGGNGGASDIGSGGAPGSGGTRADAGAAGGGGRSTVSIGPDASVSGGTVGTLDASTPDSRGADRSLRGGDAGPFDARLSDAAVPSDGGRDGGNAESAGVCSEAPCLAALFLPCQPTGVCTSDDTASPSTANQTATYCYPNGVKQQSTAILNDTSVTILFTEKRDSTMCFTIEVSMLLSADTASYIFRDGNGQQVATGTASVSSDTVTVTCNGGTPAQLTQSCMDTASAGDACNTGWCTF